MSAQVPAPPPPSSRSRELILLFIICIYFFVTFVTYSDYPNQSYEVVLTENERKGLDLWRRNNCQTCHQIFAFGGFLGPDLTNHITDDLEWTDFRSILTDGRKQMPAFNFGDEEQIALFDFLKSLGRAGEAHPEGLKSNKQIAPALHYTALVDNYEALSFGSIPPQAKEGLDTFNLWGCAQCHFPLTDGVRLAPELTLKAANRSMEVLQEVVREGRNTMPSYEDITDAELKSIDDFLEWFTDHRATMVEINDDLLEREKFSWRNIPWYEYR